MCGIIGITGKLPVTDRLIESLSRLEYRGYDSAGIAVLENGEVSRRRTPGKIVNLKALLKEAPLTGNIGIAHTRWATHGAPTKSNAHPHLSGHVAIVHNGIIENFRELRQEMEREGRIFSSDTDSETIAQLIGHYMDAGQGAVSAFETVLERLKGAFAIAAVFAGEEGLLIGARRGSPLVLGYGEGEMYLGSDAIALASLTRQVTYLEEGDWVVAYPDHADIHNARGERVNRPRTVSTVQNVAMEKGEYDHFMLKEIHEQPESMARSILPFIDQKTQSIEIGAVAEGLFQHADRMVAVACGTAHYASHISKYWFESLARLPVEIDIASEFRYRDPVLPITGPAMFVSQSGETADTLAALRYAREKGAPALAIVNVPESSIAREVEDVLPTRAGPEIGVASTKAFTAQLGVLAITALAAAKVRGHLTQTREKDYIKSLLAAPRKITEAIEAASSIDKVAQALVGVSDTLFIGRGRYFPVALEGALKLKELSYIHAEGYAAGELKHGPIALIEEGVPVIVVAPRDALFEKTISNVQEVQARGARIILISDAAGIEAASDVADYTILLPDADEILMPILAAIPVQLLAYYVAVAKGTDVDQPRNLAKSVTVE